MKVSKTKIISNGMALSIVEVDNSIAVKHFNDRFQVVLEVNGKRIFPRNKNKFLEFEENNYIYKLKSDNTGEIVSIDEVLFHELLLCDKTELDCELTLDEYDIEFAILNKEEQIDYLREEYFF